MTVFDEQVEAAWHAALDGQDEDINMKAGIKASNAVLAEKVREFHTEAKENYYAEVDETLRQRDQGKMVAAEWVLALLDEGSE